MARFMDSRFRGACPHEGGGMTRIERHGYSNRNRFFLFSGDLEPFDGYTIISGMNLGKYGFVLRIPANLNHCKTR
jgi:hypothetical protein